MVRVAHDIWIFQITRTRIVSRGYHRERHAHDKREAVEDGNTALIIPCFSAFHRPQAHYFVSLPITGRLYPALYYSR